MAAAQPITLVSVDAEDYAGPAPKPFAVVGGVPAGTVALADVTGLTAALGAKAPLASPALTGTPSAPTAAASTSTTQLATTAFVATATRTKAATVALATVPAAVGADVDELKAELNVAITRVNAIIAALKA